MVIGVTGCCCVAICVALGMIVERLLWLIVSWLWLVMLIWFACCCLGCVSDCDTVVFCVVLRFVCDLRVGCWWFGCWLVLLLILWYLLLRLRMVL